MKNDAFLVYRSDLQNALHRGDQKTLDAQLENGTDFEPTMREIRYLDKLIDELARGKAMEKFLR